MAWAVESLNDLFSTIYPFQLLKASSLERSRLLPKTRANGTTHSQQDDLQASSVSNPKASSKPITTLITHVRAEDPEASSVGMLIRGSHPRAWVLSCMRSSPFKLHRLARYLTIGTWAQFRMLSPMPIYLSTAGQGNSIPTSRLR